MTGKRSAGKFRLFVAIPVPGPIREGLICVQRELRPLAPPGTVRWTKPEQFHLTLRFLGDVPADRVPVLQESLGVVCAGAPAFPVYAHGVGFFPNPRSPRVIWVEVDDGQNHLTDLQQKIEDAVRPFTVGPGDRFVGHLTLGRIKPVEISNTLGLAAGAGAMKNRMFGEWRACRVELVRSELSMNGTVYTPLAILPLGVND